MWRYFEHPADVGIEGEGSSVEEAFCEAAKAMFNIEVDIEKVKAKEKIEISCEAETLEELFVEWLNNLLAMASLNKMIFSKFDLKIENNKIKKIFGHAYGEKLKKKHNFKTEVKAATYAELEIKKNKNWHAKCIVDV